MRTVLFAALSLIMLSGNVLHAAPITYQIGPFTGDVDAYPNTGAPPIPGPYTVSLDITTDGTLGPLQTSDVIGYSWYVNGALVGTQADGPPDFFTNGVFLATPTAITIPSPYSVRTSLDASVAVSLPYVPGNPNPLFPYLYLEVKASVEGHSPFGEDDYYYSNVTETITVAIPGDPMGPSAGVAEWNVPYEFTGDSTPFIVATAIPEPSTFVLAAIGAAALIARRWRR